MLFEVFIYQAFLFFVFYNIFFYTQLAFLFHLLEHSPNPSSPSSRDGWDFSKMAVMGGIFAGNGKEARTGGRGVSFVKGVWEMFKSFSSFSSKENNILCLKNC